MTRFSLSFKNQSLSIACFLLLLVVPMLGYLSASLTRWHEASFVLRTGLAVLCLFVLWCIAFINLIRDANRGYSPNRCSLAAVILLLAIVPVGLVGYQVLWAAAHLK